MSDLLTIQFRGYAVELSIDSYSPGYAAYVSGLPEDCYPGEAPAVEFTVTTGNGLLDELLTEYCISDLNELVLIAIADDIKEARLERETEYASYCEDRWL